MVDTAASPALPAASDPERLAALWRTELLDTAPEEAFDRIARLAERLLDVPVVLVSLVDEHRQFFKSSIGLAEPWASLRETPLEYSFCRYSVTTDAPLVIDDSRNNALVANSPAIDGLGVASYAGYPIRTVDGHVVGNLCVIDREPRTWLDWELELLDELTALVTTEVRYRLKQRSLADVESAALQLPQPVEALGDAVRSVMGDAESDGVRRRRLDVLLDRTARVEATVSDLVRSVRGAGAELSERGGRVDLRADLRRIADLASRTGDPDRLLLAMPDEDVYVVVDQEVLARALAHLLVTGLLHAGDDGLVTVHLRLVDEQVRFEATLPGRGLGPAELARLVTRFHHALEPGEESEATLRSAAGTVHAEDPPVRATSSATGTVLTFEAPRA